MVKRYDFCTGDDFSFVDRSGDGDYVLYTDHVAEMREVLEAGRMLYLNGDIESRGKWLDILDKYRGYLDKGE